MHRKAKILTAVFFAAITSAAQAGATEVLTSSLSAWSGTITGAKSEWDGNIPNNTYNTSSGYNLNVGSYGPIIVTGPDGSGYNLSKNYYGSFITLAGPSDGSGRLVFVTPAAGLTAFVLDLGITGSAGPISITLSDGEAFVANPTVGGLSLLGFSSATPITSFVLATSSGSQIQLADFYAGLSNEPAPTPLAEVATALMIGSGLSLFGACRKVYSNVSTAKA